jgi:hypothetical protein
VNYATGIAIAVINSCDLELTQGCGHELQVATDPWSLPVCRVGIDEKSFGHGVTYNLVEKVETNYEVRKEIQNADER